MRFDKETKISSSEQNDLILETKDDDTKELSSSSMKEDPDFIAIKERLNKDWLKRNEVEAHSSDHQNYLFGDPTNLRASTLEKDAEKMFREKFSEKAAEYDQAEQIRTYTSLGDDPAYKEMQEQITVLTNRDGQVNSALKSGKDYANIWKRVNFRERLHGMNDFARQYPEKSRVYAKRWTTFVNMHPEVAKMNNAQWSDWTLENDGSNQMSGYREIARAVDHVKNQEEMENIQPGIQEAEKEIANIRSQLDIPTENINADVPLSKNKERLIELQKETILTMVRSSIPKEIQSADSESLEAMYKELAKIFYLPGDDAREILDYDGVDEGVVMVDTEAIVGNMSLECKDWQFEHEDKKGRVIKIAKEIMDGSEESVENVFKLREPEKGVKLKKITGPSGDIFFVINGTNKVAGSKLVQLPELPAQVENMTGLSEVNTSDPFLGSEWRDRIEKGLIKGKVQETTTITGQKNYNLEIESQVLPWMTLPQSKLIQMTKTYLGRYPNSLNNLKTYKGEKIPPEALTNEIALKFFINGRWNEYTKKRKE